MTGRKVNPRLIEVARRQRTEGFLEREAKRLEEAKRLLEEQEIRSKEEIAQRRMKTLEGLSLEGERKTNFEAYIRGLNSYEGDKSEFRFYAFVNHPDFPKVFNQLETIEKKIDKWAFILRKAYEIGKDVDIPIGLTFQNNQVATQRALEDYGVYFLCPYFKDTVRELHPKDDCVIDGAPVMTMCEGMYEQCDIFKDRAGKAAAGLIKLPSITRRKPKFKVPKMEVDPVDLSDLYDWWEMDGIYG